MIATGPLEPVAIAPGGLHGDANRRVKIAAHVDPQLRGWLQRCARAHAHITAIVRRFGAPHKAGGASLRGDEYSERIARGDRSVLADCVTYCIDELRDIRTDIERVMDSAPPTPHEPGTRGKVEVMAERLQRGDSLFIAADAKGTCIPN
jgi:hypothetical protein